MFVNNREIALYNFKFDNNEIGFYDVDGKSVIKTLMKTPINGARLSSSFGMRKHPILRIIINYIKEQILPQQDWDSYNGIRKLVLL